MRVSTCMGHCVRAHMRVCLCVRMRVCAHGHTQRGLDGRLNRPRVLQPANGILPTQGGLWRREAKTEALCWPSCTVGGPPWAHPPLLWPPPYLTAAPAPAPAQAQAHCSHLLSLAKWHVLFSLTQYAPEPGCSSPSPCFYLAVFFCHFLLSSHVHPLLPTSTFPSSHPPVEKRGRASVGLLSCVLPPGLPSNYCILSFEKKKWREKRRKWRARRVQPLVAPSVAFITLLIELASLSNKIISF